VFTIHISVAIPIPPPPIYSLFPYTTLFRSALFIPHMKSSEELADYTITYNPRTAEKIKSYSQDFDFLPLFKELIGQDIDKAIVRSEEHTSELQSRFDLVCRLLLEKKKEDTL